MIANSHTNHKIRIDDFPVREDRKDVWDTIDFENWLGKVEIMEHLSLFFKSPIGTDENALD
ncbi:hypothetical protein AAHB50_01230 [Bacillus toyonensis]